MPCAAETAHPENYIISIPDRTHAGTALTLGMLCFLPFLSCSRFLFFFAFVLKGGEGLAIDKLHVVADELGIISYRSLPRRVQGATCNLIGITSLHAEGYLFVSRKEAKRPFSAKFQKRIMDFGEYLYQYCILF